MIEADVSPERLREFFQKDHGRYRVRKEMREKVLFAAHNVLRDAPFSRCDLISCRNLLIYLKPEAQEQVFDIFHFALRSGGLLFLGGAENHSHGAIALLAARRETPRLRASLDAAADLESADAADASAGERCAHVPAVAQASAAAVDARCGGRSGRRWARPRCTRATRGAKCSSANCICVCSNNTGRPRWW